MGASLKIHNEITGKAEAVRLPLFLELLNKPLMMKQRRIIYAVCHRNNRCAS